MNFSKLLRKQQAHRQNVLIGVPVHSSIEAETARCLFNMVFSTSSIGVQMNFRTGTLIDRARSALAEQCLANQDVDYLLFVDGDMIFPEDSLERLLAHKKDIITAFATNRNFRQVIPVIGKFKYDKDGELAGVQTMLEYPKDELFQVESCGMAMTLISKRALKKLAEAEKGRGLFQQIPLKNGGTLPEDSSFCWRAKQQGIPIYCDAKLSIGHKGPYIFTEMDYEQGFKEKLTKEFGALMP